MDEVYTKCVEILRESHNNLLDESNNVLQGSERNFMAAVFSRSLFSFFIDLNDQYMELKQKYQYTIGILSEHFGEESNSSCVKCKQVHKIFKNELSINNDQKLNIASNNFINNSDSSHSHTHSTNVKDSQDFCSSNSPGKCQENILLTKNGKRTNKNDLNSINLGKSDESSLNNRILMSMKNSPGKRKKKLSSSPVLAKKIPFRNQFVNPFKKETSFCNIKHSTVGTSNESHISKKIKSLHYGCSNTGSRNLQKSVSESNSDITKESKNACGNKLITDKSFNELNKYDQTTEDSRLNVSSSKLKVSGKLSNSYHPDEKTVAPYFEEDEVLAHLDNVRSKPSPKKVLKENSPVKNTKKSSISRHNTSFDELPTSDDNEPKHAHVGSTLRKASSRKLVSGRDCKECENYYLHSGLDRSIQDKKNSCSRHRSKFSVLNNTPEGFWHAGWNDTIEESDEDF